tara:strand:+ start:292 stop:618 length:327 start_codon:yes stop_codon:yes gene_type:complete
MSGKGNEKRILFYDTDKRHADLKVRLQYDELKQAQFFRCMITGYLEKDPRIIEYINDYKEQNSVQSKSKLKKSEQLMRKGREMEDKFGLREKDIENIFDLLEQEHPEL